MHLQPLPVLQHHLLFFEESDLRNSLLPPLYTLAILVPVVSTLIPSSGLRSHGFLGSLHPAKWDIHGFTPCSFGSWYTVFIRWFGTFSFWWEDNCCYGVALIAYDFISPGYVYDGAIAALSHTYYRFDFWCCKVLVRLTGFRGLYGMLIRCYVVPPPIPPFLFSTHREARRTREQMNLLPYHACPFSCPYQILSSHSLL